MKEPVRIALITLLALLFVVLGLYSAREYGSASALETQRRHQEQELKRADAMEDDSAAATVLKKLAPAPPEVELRIVQRQWRMALELLKYMQRARVNVELQNETASYGTRLKGILDEMLERTGSALADPSAVRPDVLWQLYNASGSAKVLSALVMLEAEQNLDKVQGIMRDALADYKSAIDAVDKAGAPAEQRNVPRWNFEVLNGREYVQKFDVAMSDTERNQALKETLETLMPEMGGYAPGEPIETIVKK
ncbi:hypothetical protein LPW11_01905 [Geomonas sp. RF6]|uniref:hypothetical protein n=1 Tax=Geomonas sp. RF6 TaxID=2897342 RepID=UPI001E5214D8|nr:hypothetical protein [Geomonas sp. RF6]UFS70951.1 hypothetical protein LPW11_01905 [Geomonas sp. RF6]